MRSKPTQADARFEKLITGEKLISTTRKMGVTVVEVGTGGVATTLPTSIPGFNDSEPETDGPTGSDDKPTTMFR